MDVTPWDCDGTGRNVNRLTPSDDRTGTHDVAQLRLGVVELLLEEFSLGWDVNEVSDSDISREDLLSCSDCLCRQLIPFAAALDRPP